MAQKAQDEEPKQRRTSGFTDRPREPPPRVDKDRYHRDVDELDYLVPKQFHEHDDRDVWVPQRGEAHPVQRAPEFSGRGREGDEYGRQPDPRWEHGTNRERRPWDDGRRDYDRRGARPRSRERSMRSDRPQEAVNGNSRRPSTRELARMDFQRSRARHADSSGSGRGFDEAGREGDGRLDGQQQAAGQGPRWHRAPRRGPADGKWGHDKFEEIKDAPPPPKDPFEKFAMWQRF